MEKKIHNHCRDNYYCSLKFIFFQKPNPVSKMKKEDEEIEPEKQVVDPLLESLKGWSLKIRYVEPVLFLLTISDAILGKCFN